MRKILFRGKRIDNGEWEVMRIVQKSSFWRRERDWQALNERGKIEETIVRPINEKIKALEKGGE